MKKKILHLVEAFGGGIFTFLVELTNATCEEYDIVIAYTIRKETPDNFKEYFDKNIKFIEVKNFTRNIGIRDIKACQEVKKIITNEKPDIVHMHSSKAGIIGRLVISSRNKKLFYTPHGYSFLKQDDSRIRRFIYKAIEKGVTVYKRKCTIIACSKGEYKEALKITKHCTYVDNGVNVRKIDEIINKEKSINVNRLKICTLGRISFQKNPEIFNKIAEKFCNIQFTWIGDGELRNDLISENIKVTGWLEKEEALIEMEKNDIFILPSLWEGLPIALLEAMYMKKICIVSNVIGNNDVIKNNINGFLCDKLEDYECVINKIKNQSIEELEEIKKNARKDILEKYNVKNMVEKYKKIYEGEQV